MSHSEVLSLGILLVYWSSCQLVCVLLVHSLIAHVSSIMLDRQAFIAKASEPVVNKYGRAFVHVFGKSGFGGSSEMLGFKNVHKCFALNIFCIFLLTGHGHSNSRQTRVGVDLQSAAARHDAKQGNIFALF